MSVADSRLTPGTLRDRTMVLFGLLIYTACAGLSYLTGITILPLVLIALPALLYFGFKAVQVPFLMLILISVASYLGNMANVIEDGLIPISLFQIAYVAGLGVFMMNRLITGNPRIKISGIELELLLLMAFVFFTTIYTGNQADGLFYATRFLVLSLFLYLILNTIESSKQMLMLFGILVGVSLVLAVLSIRQGLMNPEAAALSILMDGLGPIGARGRVSHSDPNIFATHFFIPIAFIVCLVISQIKFVYKAGIAVLLPILLLGLMATYSRSAWVSAIVIVVIIAVVYRQYKFFVIGALGIFVALLVLPGIRESLVNVVMRFFEIFAGAADDSSRMRIVLMYFAIRRFLESYLLGVGFRGFSHEFLKEHSTFETFGVYEPHNVTYTVLVEMGIIGFLIFSFFLFRIYKAAWENIKNSKNEIHKAFSVSVFACLVGFAVFYQFLGGGFTDNNIWLLVGLTFVLKHTIIPESGKKDYDEFVKD